MDQIELIVNKINEHVEKPVKVKMNLEWAENNLEFITTNRSPMESYKTIANVPIEWTSSVEKFQLVYEGEERTNMRRG